MVGRPSPRLRPSPSPRPSPRRRPSPLPTSRAVVPRRIPMARRKKGKDAEPAQPEASGGESQASGDEGPPDNEPTQVDAVITPGEQPAGDEGAEVTNPLAGDTDKLYTDQPPVPPDVSADEEKLATVTDISSAAQPEAEAPAEEGAVEA